MTDHTTHDLAIARAERDAWQSTCEELHRTIAGRDVEIEAHLGRIEAADQRARSFEAALTAEREASKGLVAQVEAVRADSRHHAAIAAQNATLASERDAHAAELAAIRDLVAPGNPQGTVVDAVRAMIARWSADERDLRAAIARAEKAEAEIAGALSGLAERLPVTPPTLAAAVDAVREAWDADRSAGARSAAETTTALVTADRELAKLRAAVAELTVSNRTAAERMTMFVEASSNADRLTAERDALAAQLAEVRAKLDAAPKVCAIHSYEHGPGPCMTCGAWPPGTRELIAACRTRIAGLERAANERSAEVARLTALVAELEARPVLTHEILSAAIKKARKVPPYIARQAADEYMPHLGPVMLPAQDLAEELTQAIHGTPREEVNPAMWRGMVERTRSALASLGAPPTSPPSAPTLGVNAVPFAARLAEKYDERRALMDEHGDTPSGCMQRALISTAISMGIDPFAPTSPPAARPVFAGLDELARTFWCATGRGYKPEQWETLAPSTQAEWIKGTAAVLARLEVSLVAPVDPIALALNFAEGAGVSPGTIQRSRAEAAMRAALTAAGIPVTPEVGK